MKNQYFGDVNDYRKCGLLRCFADTGVTIGVCWLLTEDDGKGDGELRQYLTKPSRWRRYDAQLYEKLQRLAEPGVRRTVRHAAEWGLVPGAIYFDERLVDAEDRRDAYFKAAFAALAGSDLVFFDPDVGLEVPSKPRGKRGSAGYVYWSELAEAYGRGHSLLVYQHYPHVDRTRFVPFLAVCLSTELRAVAVSAFVTAHVAFFLVQQSRHRTAFQQAAAAVGSRWPGQIAVWRQDGGAVQQPVPADSLPPRLNRSVR